MRRMLSLLNIIFVRLQRWVQGIPRGPAHLYDSIATKYLEPSYDYVIEEAQNRISRDQTVLEVGCGAGKLLSEIAGRIKPKNTVGLDISRAMVEISRRNLIRCGRRSDVNLIVADAHKMPLRSEYFDLIVSTGTLHQTFTGEAEGAKCQIQNCPS